MITPVLMPQLGLEVTEATILEILVTVGQSVANGEPLIELETEKATTVVESPRAGFVVAIEVAPGGVVPVGAPLAHIGDHPGEADGNAAALVTAARAGAAAGAAHAGANGEAHGSGPRPIVGPGGRLRAAPVARRAAAELGVVLDQLAGSGPRGRITLRDVQHAAQQAAATAEAAAPAEAPGPPEAPAPAAPETLGKLRRAIARRMTASQLIPQYELQRDIDASHLLAQKQAVATGTGPGATPGVNDLLIQSIAETVARHPALATSFVAEPEPAIVRRTSIGVGLAIATERGLLVAVIEDADRAGLGVIAERRTRLVGAARNGTLTQTEMTGGAITLSNLGSFGVDRFTAMLNPGESSIVAVGRSSERVVPRGRGIAIVPVLTVTMTFDHRTIDGAVGAAALAELCELLEGRMTWRP